MVRMTDSQLIEKLGGPAKVAKLLGFTTFGVQRVFNWKKRGIPPKVKLDHPDIFLAHLMNRTTAQKSKAA